MYIYIHTCMYILGIYQAFMPSGDSKSEIYTWIVKYIRVEWNLQEGKVKSTLEGWKQQECGKSVVNEVLPGNHPRIWSARGLWEGSSFMNPTWNLFKS